ncbi:trypsin-like peptidase domain-containing protein [Akkermansiaceae bacterium]|nr:trypsin-like peptidase domain-containing protein [Akkermansiaceae bacterium]MDA8980766.1 trypsin-like peptidase domain-containing protein [bacterium]MDA7538061.1 trypsin-like peptidase domain-containing protein [Akkermansiaceae bacterium]MDA7649047.1 trypsin-like peptidase domain-containing protein [Akkermansiaceae bacterium]MDA7862974.1 trypsin-like peptidase domain-containing protein [Akkermansiaceae bacterium]
MRFLLSLTLFLLLPLSSSGQLLDPAQSSDPAPLTVYDSVVRIEVSTQTPDYGTPWNSGRFGGGIGTGFLIGKNRFLTNAHVVSDARRVLITKRGSSQKHPARVLHIAHDCDLALLEVEDFAPFSQLPVLEFGGMPRLESEVSAIGYPVGGDRLSVTRGIVSRIDFRPYAHSRADSHLVIQIDAAINPGNSGGPVIQDGKVVGVAFQGLTQADNTGYIIPMPVVSRFLKDVEDGKYDHYMDIGLSTFPLFNPAMRKAFNLQPDGKGVLVASVVPGSQSEGVIERNDILLTIDGYEIDSAGNIQVDGEFLDMNEVVERKFAGDEVTLTFLRSGEQKTAKVTLKAFEASRIYAMKYGVVPRFSVYAGLVFQPLDFNLFATYKFDNRKLRQLYDEYISEGLHKDRKDVVVLTRVESDQLTSNLSGFAGMVVEKVNDKEIKSLKELHEILHQENPPEFLTIEFSGGARPLVMPSAEAAAAHPRIMQQVGISREAVLD